MKQMSVLKETALTLGFVAAGVIGCIAVIASAPYVVWGMIIKNAVEGGKKPVL